MADLDSTSEIQKLDSKNLSGSIELLAKQCQQVFADVSRLDFSSKNLEAKKIVVMGMGGSTLGTHIISSLYFAHSKVPLEVVRGYHIPGYVGSDTLVLLSSYSGTTEEVLFGFREAKEKGAKIISISSGGDLGKLVEDKEVEGYVFKPTYNPSGQPRMGLGYSILSQILILAKLDFLVFSEEDLAKIVDIIGEGNAKWGMGAETSQNEAKQIAKKLIGKIPFLFASEHLTGNIHVFANQINENAKTLSAYFTLPEADHHLIEGLPSFKGVSGEAVFFFLKSALYTDRVVKRYDITKQLAEKSNFDTVVFVPNSQSRLEQVFEFLTLGSWVSFYLAMLYDRDPSPIPAVDFLKSEMAKA